MATPYMIPLRPLPASQEQRSMNYAPLGNRDVSPERDLTFESQHELHAWLAGAQPLHCQEVDALSFTLTLDDDEEIDNESEAIVKSLSSLPKVRSFELYKLPADVGRRSHHILYADLLRQLSHLWPRLEALTAHTDGHQLRFLTRLEYLQRFHFTGYAATRPMELVSIFGQMRHLTALEITPALGPLITRLEENPTPSSSSSTSANADPCLTTPIHPESSDSPSSAATHTTLTASPEPSPAALTNPLPPPLRHFGPSFTQDLVRALRPRRLRALTLRESRASDPAAPAFCTWPLLAALEATVSRAGFASLTVELRDFQPSRLDGARLCRFLARSRLRHVDLAWPALDTGGRWDNRAMDTAVVEALPQTLVNLRMSGLGMGEGVRALAGRKGRGELRDLERVTVVLTEPDRMVVSDIEVSNAVDEAVLLLSTAGVNVYLV